MKALRALFYALLKWPVRICVRCKLVHDQLLDNLPKQEKKPILYVVRHQSASDLITLQKACEQLNLPDPFTDVEINGKKYQRVWCIDKASPLIFKGVKRKTKAIEHGLKMLEAHQIDKALDAQLIPVNINWGRQPGVEKAKANAGTLLADQESPNWLRKFFIVLFLGRHALVRFSNPLSFRYMSDHHGNDIKAAQKMLRVARFHFHRQTLAATGPRLLHRQQMFTALLANPAVKRVLEDEQQSKKISAEEAKKRALKIMDEIAGDYREATIRVGERILTWLFNRLYQKLDVNNAELLRNTAQNGDEIIYVPCHRSHMDYLLLTYIIYHQGLVTPRIAAGINLNFWPAGPIFRKAGAFFIRRSFRGNRLYSTIFREYLGLLFERGYAVKYYTEGGRSRTGKLLQPKTGMLAMTIQSLLRGIERPLTLVPVYLGYEHVMEVATYHKELSGSKKQGESILGVVKAIRNLRNYGNGYINFGQPININQFLNHHVDNWKASIDPVDPQKPNWLTPTVNLLADQVMTSINQCAALNGVSLVAMVLLAAQNNAMTKKELAAQLDFILTLQKQSPYSELMTIPEQDGLALVEHVIGLNKVTVTSDSFGEVISITPEQQLDLSYYRNNVLHTMIVPALLCRLLDKHSKITKTDIIQQISLFVALLKQDLFLCLSANDVASQVNQLLDALISANKVKVTKAGFYSLVEQAEVVAKIRLFGQCIDQSLQRFAILLHAVKQSGSVNKSELEQNATTIAKRLLLINSSDAPEFTDKKAQSILINAMHEQGFIAKCEQGKFAATEKLHEFEQVLLPLMGVDMLQSFNL